MKRLPQHRGCISKWRYLDYGVKCDTSHVSVMDCVTSVVVSYPVKESEKRMKNRSAIILEALGGQDNIVDLEPCSTRLRVEVSAPLKVDEDMLRNAGVLAVVRAGRIVQVVVGPIADEIATEISNLP